MFVQVVYRNCSEFGVTLPTGDRYRDVLTDDVLPARGLLLLLLRGLTSLTAGWG